LFSVSSDIIKFKNWIYDYPIGENIETIGIINNINDLTLMKNIYSKSLLYYNGYS
jgi:hypothetical protein